MPLAERLRRGGRLQAARRIHVEDRLADARRLEVERRGCVRGGPARRFIPAAVLRVVAHLLHLPHAVLAHVRVLVDAAGPRGVPLVAAEHRHDVPARLARLAVGRQRHHRLHRDVRIDASVGEPQAPLADLFDEEVPNPLAIERALRVVADAGVGEEIREVVPQPQLRVVAVGVLQPLDRRDRFHALRQRLEPVHALLQRRQVGIGTADDRPCGAPDDDGQHRERAARDHPGHAWLLDSP